MRINEHFDAASSARLSPDEACAFERKHHFGGPKEAIVVSDHVAARFGATAELSLREQAANALVKKKLIGSTD